MKTILMTGAALAMLAGAPCFASQSTPAEREATRQLNLQASQAAASNAMPISEVPTNMAMNAPPSAASTTRVAIADTGAPLSTVMNPPNKIATASVMDSSGTIVGAVQRVEVSPQGQPTKVVVALIGKDERMVILDAGAVSYDADRNQILTQASGAQIAELSGRR
jgi:hypothetical protein